MKMKNKIKIFCFLICTSLLFSSVIASQEVFRLRENEISGLVLLDTKKIANTWEACFKTLESNFLHKKLGDSVGGEQNKIIKITDNGVFVSSLVTANQSEYITITYFIPIVENDSEKDKCVENQ